jgi:hypothetical protein
MATGVGGSLPKCKVKVVRSGIVETLERFLVIQRCLGDQVPES